MAELGSAGVLVVHPDAFLRARVASILRARGHPVQAVGALESPADPTVVVVIDHLALPVAVRSPVLALVPDRDEGAILAAFEAGADDVLAGPPRPAELASRVAVLNRRSAVPARIGPITIDPAGRRVTLDGRLLELTRSEYELLSRLAAAPGRVFTKQELLRDSRPVAAPTRRLDSQVARLRRRLGAHRALLVTVWGVGYRLG